MKIKKDFILRNVAGTNVVVATGERSSTFNKLIKLNSSASLLWKKLEEGADKAALCEALTDAFDVDAARAAADVDAFISVLTDADLLD